MSVPAVVLGVCLLWTHPIAIAYAATETATSCTVLTSALYYQLTDAVTNGQVTKLQTFLNNKQLLMVPATGYYGNLTVAAVRAYQKSVGLDQVGRVGPLTRASIQKETCSDAVPTPTVCTAEYRACTNGSPMPRDASCVWHPEQCSSDTSGAVSLSIPSCSIAVGAKTCIARPSGLTHADVGKSYTLSNTTTGVVTEQAYTATGAYVANPVTVGTALDLAYGENTLRLSVSGTSQTIATVTATASCVAGSSWNGTNCAAAESVGITSFSINGGRAAMKDAAYGLSYSTTGAQSCKIEEKSNVSSTWNSFGYYGPYLTTATFSTAAKADSLVVGDNSYRLTCYSGANGTGSASPSRIEPFFITQGGPQGSPPPSGRFTLTTATCSISDGDSGCSIPVSWIVSNPASPSVRQNAVQFSTTAAGSALSRTLTYDTNTFTLYDGSQVLDTVTATASCLSGSIWNGSACVSLAMRIQAAQSTANQTDLVSSCGALNQNISGGNNGFYWEIGDKNGIITDATSGLQASGSVQPAGTPGTNYTRSTVMAIASGSKWIYGSYAAEKTAVLDANGNWKIPSLYVPFLNFTSGYTNMTSLCPFATAPTVADCLNLTNAFGRLNGSINVSDVGYYSYGSGHMQVFEGGGDPSSSGVMNGAASTPFMLKTNIIASFSPHGVNPTFVFTNVILAGGISASAEGYAPFLQGLVTNTNPLIMKSLLKPTASDPYAVCTSTTDAQCVDAQGNRLSHGTPSPDGLSFHYSIGHWIEDDPATGDGAYSSAGAFGFYPWVDATKTYYGILARHDTTAGEQQGFRSLACGRTIRKAFMTGQVQH